MSAFEKGWREASSGIISTQLYVLMPGYRNGHDAAVAATLRDHGRLVDLPDKRDG